MPCTQPTNTGNKLTRCNKGNFIGGFFSEEKFTRTASEMVTQSDWETLFRAIAPTRVYPSFNKKNPLIVAQRELQTEELSSGATEDIGQTPYSFSFDIVNPTYKEERDFLFKGTGTIELWGMLLTKLGYLEGNLESDSTYSARKYTISKIVKEAEEGTTKKLTITIREESPYENTEKADALKPTDFSYLELEGIVDVNINIVSAIATAVVFTVTADGDDTFKISDMSLTSSDWSLGVGTISSITYDATTGQYTAVTVGAATGTFDYASPSVTETDYETVESASITV